MDGLLKYSEFTSAFLPVDQHYARQLGSKRLQYCNQPTDGRASSAFCYETMKCYKAVWLQILKVEQSFEEIKGRLKSRPLFDLDKAFRSCDQSFNGAITASDVSISSLLPFILLIDCLGGKCQQTSSSILLLLCSLTD